MKVEAAGTVPSFLLRGAASLGACAGAGVCPLAQQEDLGYPSTSNVPRPQPLPYSCPSRALATSPGCGTRGHTACRSPWCPPAWERRMQVAGTRIGGRSRVHPQQGAAVSQTRQISKSTGGTAGAEAALCLWLNERHFPVLSELFNSLKLLLLFSFNRNANMSAFLGGFIKYPAHHSEPHNSCQVPHPHPVFLAESEFL